MTTKTLDRPAVEFYATSPRLVQACRYAARRNKSLARGAEIHELVPGSTHPPSAKQLHGLKMVVISHADDNLLGLTDSLRESVFSEAFHLLFTEPATHPGQVAQWMRTTNIRSENRLHVVKVDHLEAPQVSQLLGRVCFALGPDGSCAGIIEAYLAGNSILVRGPKHRLLHVPVSSVPALRGQPRPVLVNFHIDPDGSFIAWPDLDVQLGWNQFLQAVDPGELHKAQQRSAGFNQRYGEAIRTVRAAAGILQSNVAGLTGRQLRRIEQGQCRATTAALAALAKAHGLDVNAYMESLAKAMR